MRDYYFNRTSGIYYRVSTNEGYGGMNLLTAVGKWKLLTLKEIK